MLFTIENYLSYLHQKQYIPEHEYARAHKAITHHVQDKNPLLRLAQLQLQTTDGKPLSLDMLTQYAAQALNLRYMKVDPLQINVQKVTSLMNLTFAQHNQILPLKYEGQEVWIGTALPQNIQAWKSILEKQAKVNIEVVIISPLDVQKYIPEFFNVAKSVKNVQKPLSNGGLNNFEQLVDLSKADKPLESNDQGVIRVVDWLWQYAFEQRASDIHLEPRREHGVIRFRIDGILHNVYQLPLAVLGAMTSRIKSLGRMDVVEKRRPLDGRIKTRGQYGEIEMRLSTLPTAFGEKMVMRIFDPLVTVKNQVELGFKEHDVIRWEELVQRPYGIILVTGPTGSGKTTTLYSTLKRLATEEVNVNTIEDPIEMVEPLFNQTQVQPQLDFGFAEGLRTLMRQDPDIIMVGEIRDLETAEMAIQAALTGHLVFSTMHTNDAPSAISRLIELGVPAYLINATVIGVLAQRLVRTLCNQCKVLNTEVDYATVKEMARPWKLPEPYTPYKPVGCERCRNTGYKGRTGVYELLSVSEEFKEQVHETPHVASLRRQAFTDGMRPLRYAGLQLFLEGITTLEEVVEATPAIALSKSEKQG